MFFFLVAAWGYITAVARYRLLLYKLFSSDFGKVYGC